LDGVRDVANLAPEGEPRRVRDDLNAVAASAGAVGRQQAAPSQIALAWLMAQKPWIVPIPGTTVMAHMLENNGASGIQFTPAELTELNSAVRAIEVRGQRLPDAVLVFSGVEAPPKS
jgi:aryl-alcohol dehydrogenase-like predicted oxidoreductase